MELIANKSFLVKKDAKSFNDLKKNGISKKKKLFLYVFFPGESSRTKKNLKKLCRADFDVRAPYFEC
jgi:hypothetical protein